MAFCLIIVGFSSLNDRYLIRAFKATSRIFRQCIEILCYGLKKFGIPWDFIPLKFFLSIIITFIIIIINHHFCMEHLLLHNRSSFCSVYNVASILWLHCMIHVILLPMINTTYFHITIIIIIIIIIIPHFSALAGKYSPILGFSNQQD
jgi:hypothetical protein